MVEGERLQNIILSSNPCPICEGAADQEPMAHEEWAGSEWGLPESLKRYCNLKGACHCLLIPVGAMDELPEISKLVKLRNEEGSEIKSIVEITPNEQSLKNVMDEWNTKYGKLPQEIYDMDVFDVEPYLRKLMKKRGGGGALRGASGYLNQKINYGGEIKTRGAVISEMQKAGTSQRLIDSYMIGAKEVS